MFNRREFDGELALILAIFGSNSSWLRLNYFSLFETKRIGHRNKVLSKKRWNNVKLSNYCASDITVCNSKDSYHSWPPKRVGCHGHLLLLFEQSVNGMQWHKLHTLPYYHTNYYPKMRTFFTPFLAFSVVLRIL